MKLWGTLNEPAVFVVFGHDVGCHAPGEKRSRRDWLLVAHNALRAHAAAVPALRAAVPGAKVGCALNIVSTIPATRAAADVEAARQALFRMDGEELWGTAWYSDPILEGRYPADGVARFGKDLPAGWEADVAAMKQPLDWLGLNIYTGSVWRAGAGGAPEAVRLPSDSLKPLFLLTWARVVVNVAARLGGGHAPGIDSESSPSSPTLPEDRYFILWQHALEHASELVF